MEPSDVPDANATVLYVGNLDKRVTDTMMINILRTGLPHIKEKVLSASMFPGDMNNPEGYCFVQFEDNISAMQSMNFLNGREFCGKKVKVNWATNSPNGMPKVIGTSVSIYCGNLDDTIDEEDLKAAFEVFGEILNIKVVRDPVTNHSKNIAFISFTNKPDAEKAIREMHGAMLKTRAIKTNWATRNQNQKKEEQDYDEVYKGASTDNTTVYAGGIPSNCTEEQIRNHFDDYGKIVDVRIFAAKNYAFIKFDTHANAATAICKSNGTELVGSCLKCWWGKDGGPESSHGGSGYTNHSSSHYSSSAASYQSMQDQSQYAQMTPQQQQQYMQYMQYHPYYQQQYYHYWMQQYQAQMQQSGGQQAYQQQQSYQQQAYPQQQQTYNQQNYQS